MPVPIFKNFLTPGSLIDSYLQFVTGAATNRLYKITGNTSDTIYCANANFVSDGVQPGDEFFVYSVPSVWYNWNAEFESNKDSYQWVRDIQKGRDTIAVYARTVGAGTSYAYLRVLKINKNLFDVKLIRDSNKIVNSLTVKGMADSTTTTRTLYSANTTDIAQTYVRESVLRDDITATATTIYLKGDPWYPPSGTIKIGNETMTYSGFSYPSISMTVSRSSGVPHAAGEEVILMSSFHVCSSTSSLPWYVYPVSWMPSSGSIWVGSEKITFTGKSTGGSGDIQYTNLTGITRGAGGTPIYAHTRGIHVRNAAYTDTSPQSGSSVKLYGIKEGTAPAYNVNDRNALDMYCQEYITATKDLRVYGEGRLAAYDLGSYHFAVGNYFIIEAADTNDREIHKLTAITVDQAKGIIYIEFGMSDEYLTDKLKFIDHAIRYTMVREERPQLATVSATVANANYVIATTDDGREIKVYYA